MLGQQVDHEAGQPQREHRRQQHQERQQRAAVDHDEDQRDDAAGDEQQDAVDAAERLHQVGDLPGGPGDEHGQPGRGAAEPGPDLLDDVGRVAVGEDRHGQLHGLVVPRRLLRPAERAGDAGDTAQLLRLRVEEPPVFGGQAAGALGHDRRGQHLTRGEDLLLVGDLGGFGRARQEGRVVVLRDFAQLPGERAAEPAQREPGHHQERGDQPPEAARGLVHGR
ncbi:hypothetical protein H480_29091 [Amycolatopsis vancoresmycina DSM 44592]|uniref:Uncharacterized protein n=1 Tax=Amycolatopsis vancoresmycina DSM 44592 TaxID=1292037 RepID=R1G0D8_9PSEU|nr:hypothetical protein H480_29091 [Amycolatopsis vancoresmycina DSM 44592]